MPAAITHLAAIRSTDRVSPDMPPRPDSLYGAFKVYGETILRNYFDRHGIRSVSMRIGTYRTLPIDQRSLATWLSPADVARLVDASLRHPDPGCLIVNGYSANTRIKIADTNWEFLGYEPKDNAEDHIEMLRTKGIDVDGPWEWPEHGGSHAACRSGDRNNRLLRGFGVSLQRRARTNQIAVAIDVIDSLDRRPIFRHRDKR